MGSLVLPQLPCRESLFPPLWFSAFTSLLNSFGDNVITMEGSVDMKTLAQYDACATSCLKARCHMFVFILSMAHRLNLQTRWVRAACVFLGYYKDSMSCYLSFEGIGLCMRTCMFVSRKSTIFCQSLSCPPVCTGYMCTSKVSMHVCHSRLVVYVFLCALLCDAGHWRLICGVNMCVFMCLCICTFSISRISCFFSWCVSM